jgi:hypothetical protein
MPSSADLGRAVEQETHDLGEQLHALDEGQLGALNGAEDLPGAAAPVQEGQAVTGGNLR